MPARTLDLRDKQHPSEELPKAITRDWYLHYTTPQNKQACFNAGQAMLNKMKSLMKTKGQDGLGDLPDSLGDCGLRRAFHDELGVRKVVFKFSDDVLSTVYTLESNWDLFAPELTAIFKTAGVNPRRVIRCLLAEMSPDVTIPVHHDTGYWATRSHRVHMPIITREDLVEFYTGKTEQTLLRVPFPQFHIIELNNRAKHSVVNGWDKPRVHLIFDFVEEHEPSIREIGLKQSDVVYQTRRTISINVPCEASTTVDACEEEELTAQDRPKLVQALMSKIRAAHANGNASADVGQRMVNRFVKMSKRYSDGELLVSTYCQVLQECFAHETEGAARDVARLLTDRERARALRVGLLAQPTPAPVAAAPAPALPFFVIAGVMKCGTTSLFEYINRHPQCVRARQKEPHAFDWVWNQVQMLQPAAQAAGVDGDLPSKYACAFPPLPSPSSSFTGEATPSYVLGGAEVMRRVVAGAPRDRALKTIIILRDPVERAWSHYRMTADVDDSTRLSEDQIKRRGSVRGRSFAQLVDDDLQVLEKECQVTAGKTLGCEFEAAYLAGLPAGHGAHSYVGRGLYALQLELLFSVVPRDEVLVLQLEHLERDLQGEMDRVFSFLGVDPSLVRFDGKGKGTEAKDEHPQQERFNVGKLKVAKTAEDEKTLQRLREFYAPHNARLRELLPEVKY